MPELVEGLRDGAEEQDGQRVRFRTPGHARDAKPLSVGLDEFQLQRRADLEEAARADLRPACADIDGVTPHPLLSGPDPDGPSDARARTEAPAARAGAGGAVEAHHDGTVATARSTAANNSASVKGLKSTGIARR